MILTINEKNDFCPWVSLCHKWYSTSKSVSSSKSSSWASVDSCDYEEILFPENLFSGSISLLSLLSLMPSLNMKYLIWFLRSDNCRNQSIFNDAFLMFCIQCDMGWLTSSVTEKLLLLEMNCIAKKCSYHFQFLSSKFMI